MATETTNYKFKKPDNTDFYNIADQNGNWDECDKQLKALDNGKAATTHNHDGVYSPSNHNHTGVYAPVSHKHAKSDITDFPTSLPASDVSAWAKQPTKPTYNASEVGALPAGGKAVSAGSADNAGHASNADKTDGYHIAVMTQASYDALGSKDASTIYFTY